MDELTLDEVKQLVVFYRNRAIELETQLLSLQLKSARPEEPVTKTKKTTAE